MIYCANGRPILARFYAVQSWKERTVECGDGVTEQCCSHIHPASSVFKLRHEATNGAPTNSPPIHFPCPLQFWGPPFDLRQCDVDRQLHGHLTTDNHLHQRVQIVYPDLLIEEFDRCCASFAND